MKLIINHDRNDAICDILVYLYTVCDEKHGVFSDVHPKTYEMGISQYLEKDVPFVYDGITFEFSTKGDLKVVGYRIEKYKQLVLTGDESKIFEFCKQAFIHSELRINNTKIENKLNIFNYDCTWCYMECCEKRNLDSLNFPKNQVSEIIADVKQFISEETKEKYKSLSIPHSRTYMLYGPPGTGKTSLIKSIASEIDYSIGIIEFDSDMDDKALKRAISKRPKNSILVFEDIDSLFESRKKSDEFSTSVTFSGLLNTFDGVISHENLIVIFTTNHIEILDGALKRRVDYFLKFDFATKTQIKNMYARFYPTQVDKFDVFFDKIKHVKLTPNILQKFFTKHLYDIISDYGEELCNFATGEISVDTLKNMYT